MAEILKPANLSLTWASGGDILDPGTTKYATGWQVEIPPRQWFNYLDNRQDEAIAHINQHGIAVWDANTEYQANKSFVTGSNGSLYRALTTNTNIDPVTDLGVNWLAVATLPLASATEAREQTSNTTLLTPLRLADSMKGSNQNLSSNGFQIYPGGKIEQWGIGNAPVLTTGSILFPIAFPSAVVNIQLTDITGAASTVASLAVTADSVSLTGFTYYGAQGVTPTAPGVFYWFAVGY